MNDAILFGFGCFVSLIVAFAVGLLVWSGASEELPEDEGGNTAGS